MRIAFTSRPRYVNCVKKDGSSTVRYYRSEIKCLRKTAALGIRKSLAMFDKAFL